MLEHMENLLETRHNGRYGEFGTFASIRRMLLRRVWWKKAHILCAITTARTGRTFALYAFAKKMYGMDVPTRDTLV
jgi:hypothetical protein